MTVQPKLKNRRLAVTKFCLIVQSVNYPSKIHYHTFQNHTASGTRVFATSNFRTTTSDYNTAVSGWRLGNIHIKFVWQSHKPLLQHYIERVVTIMRFWRGFISSWPHSNIDTTQCDCKLPTLRRNRRYYGVLWFLSVAPVSTYTHKL